VAAERSLALYLQGHHGAGRAAVAAVRRQAAIEPGSEVGRLLARLGDEVVEDLATLRDVMARLGVRPSRLHDAGARLGAGVGRWTLRAHRPGPHQARLVGLESLSLGIEGKLRLWLALREVVAGDRRLDGVDLDALIARAEQQRGDLEPHRLGAARRAHGTGAPPDR
jgi:hypothetical protein